jgi:predicted membrane protein
MRNRGALFIGSLLVIFGLALLLGNLLNINIWAICWPVGLILIGIWLVLRPRLALPGTLVNIRFIDDEKRYGPWQASNEEFWSFINSIRLDLTKASLPPGETILHMYGFVGNPYILVPQDVGFSISSIAFLTSARINGHKSDQFVAPATFTSDNYASAERKIRLESYFFVMDLDAKQA